MKKNPWTKIMALFALFWIIISIVWTGTLIVYDLYTTNNTSLEQQLTPEQFDELMKSYSWSLTSTWELNTATWEVSN